MIFNIVEGDTELFASLVLKAKDKSAACVAANWWKWCGTDCQAGWESALQLASNDTTFLWYIGVTETPFERMMGDPTKTTVKPHKHRYNCLYPLLIIRDAAELEKRWIADLTSHLGWSRRGNVGPGGEHVLAGSVKFVYICIRWQKGDIVEE